MPYLRAVLEAEPEAAYDNRHAPRLNDAPLSDVEPGRDLAASGTQKGRQIRRLPERILVAAHQACDLGALDVAAGLLSTLEVVLQQQPGGSFGVHRRTIEGMVAAYERLWHLRRPEHGDADPFASSS
jgi:hypothetical protein